MLSAKRLKLVSVLLAMSLLSGCATLGSGTECKVFRPITWSSKDTPETREQVVAHNYVGKAVCGWSP